MDASSLVIHVLERNETLWGWLSVGPGLIMGPGPSSHSLGVMRGASVISAESECVGRILRTLIGRRTLSALAIFVIIIAGVLSSGCGGNSGSMQNSGTTTSDSALQTATIRVTGTSGTPFKGSYESKSAGKESVKGKVPQDYEVTYNSLPSASDTVRADMQKLTQDSSKLTVQIIVDEETKKEHSTGTDFGVAMVRWSPTVVRWSPSEE
jgi:hypothetical protein